MLSVKLHISRLKSVCVIHYVYGDGGALQIIFVEVGAGSYLRQKVLETPSEIRGRCRVELLEACNKLRFVSTCPLFNDVGYERLVQFSASSVHIFGLYGVFFDLFNASTLNMAKENGEPTSAQKGKGKAEDLPLPNGDKTAEDGKKDKDGKPLVNGKKGGEPQEGTQHRPIS